MITIKDTKVNDGGNVYEILNNLNIGTTFYDCDGDLMMVVDNDSCDKMLLRLQDGELYSINADDLEYNGEGYYIKEYVDIEINVVGR